MPDSLLEWARENLTNLRPNSNGEFLAECPFCERDENQFSINLEAGGGYSCLRARCGNKGPDPAWLISKFEGISIHEARKKYSWLNNISSKKRGMILSASRMKKREYNEKNMILESFPPGFTSCYDQSRPESRRWLIPKYLNDRCVTKDIIKKFEIGFCVSPTSKYNKHIILPCYHKNEDGDMIGGFIGRNTEPKDKDDRYNNHFGPWVQHMIYGYHQCIEAKPRHIVLCEGPFDALRLWQYGYHAMALMGVALKNGQKSILNKRFPSDCRITVLLDENEYPSAQDVASKIYNIFSSIRIAMIKGNKDPGESTEEEVFEAIIQSHKA